MGAIKQQGSENSEILSSGTERTLGNIKGITSLAEGTLSYTDKSGVQKTISNFPAFYTPPFCIGNVTIHSTTSIDLMILK